MRKITTCVSLLLSMLLLSFVPGCGGNGVSGKKTMELSEMGVSITIPEGWQLDNPQACHKGDNTGLLMEEGLEGQSFEKSAAQMSQEFGSVIISESKLTINGHNAIKAVINTPAGDRLLRIYIHKGGKIIIISFVISKEEYPAHESALQQSMQSIII